jgi:predicted acylesterase/phospholipase RssA
MQMLSNNSQRPAVRGPAAPGHGAGSSAARKLPSPAITTPLHKPAPLPSGEELQQQSHVSTHAQSVSSLGAGGWAMPAPGSPGNIFVPSHQQQQQLLQQQPFLDSSSYAEAPARASKLRLGWAGAGIFFFWQLGAVKYLAEHYDLSKVSMAGASAGSFISVLAACGVDADRAVETAYAMSLEHDIWSRPLGLIGIWGSLIERWLDELLPHDAAERCRGRVEVVVSVAPSMAQRAISDFRDKRDLIEVCMASAHVPLFLDRRLMRPCRDMLCVDGSFPDFFTGVNCEHLTMDETVVFDYFDDPALNRNGRFDMLSVKQYKEIRRIMTKGYLYAAKLRKAGRLAHFDGAPHVLRSQ